MQKIWVVYNMIMGQKVKWTTKDGAKKLKAHMDSIKTKAKEKKEVI